MNFPSPGGRGAPGKVFYGKVNPRGPSPYSVIHHFCRGKATRFVYRTEGGEIDSHPELGIFSEFSGITILLLANSIDNGTPSHS